MRRRARVGPFHQICSRRLERDRKRSSAAVTLPVEEVAFGAVQLQRKGEIGPALPAIIGQQGGAGGKIGERRNVGRRSLCALAGDQIELGQPARVRLVR